MSLRCSMVGLALAVVCLTGCAEMQEAKINLRNRYLADEAWKSLKETYECMNYEVDFSRGFKAGYYDVASGANGCPPILPPERYWSVKYMSTTGRARTEAWFSGFRYGAMVAEQDGVGVFIELPTSLPPEPERQRVSDMPPEEEEVPIEPIPVTPPTEPTTETPPAPDTTEPMTPNQEIVPPANEVELPKLPEKPITPPEPMPIPQAEIK